MKEGERENIEEKKKENIFFNGKLLFFSFHLDLYFPS